MCTSLLGTSALRGRGATSSLQGAERFMIHPHSPIAIMGSSWIFYLLKLSADSCQPFLRASNVMYGSVWVWLVSFDVSAFMQHQRLSKRVSNSPRQWIFIVTWIFTSCTEAWGKPTWPHEPTISTNGWAVFQLSAWVHHVLLCLRADAIGKCTRTDQFVIYAWVCFLDMTEYWPVLVHLNDVMERN